LLGGTNEKAFAFYAYLSRLFLVQPASATTPSVGFSLIKSPSDSLGAMNCNFGATGYTLP